MTGKYWLVYRCHTRWRASGPYSGADAAREAARLLLCQAEAYVVPGAMLDRLGRRWRRERAMSQDMH